ncbi:unnamed protein product [Cunninghamella echinulata]
METPELLSPSNYYKHKKKYGGWDKDLKFTYSSREEEIINAFENVQYVLNSVGSSWDEVCSVTSYHVPLDSEVTSLFPKLFKKYIGNREPIWTCVGVSELGEKEMHVEIVVTAIKE